MSDLELLTIGRVNLDLYAQHVNAEFVEAKGFDAMVGGSPVNVAVGAARLGVRAGVLSAVGEDLVGDWVLHALAREGVSTEFVARKAGPHTSLALLGQLGPDHPLVFYRHDPADIHLQATDVLAAPVERARVLLASADALARGAMADTCRAVLRRARAAPTVVYLELDLRDVNWPSREAYASTVGAELDQADVIVGTDAEFVALLGLPDHAGDTEVLDAVEARFDSGPARTIVVKHGAAGATVLTKADRVQISPFAVRPASTVGAGDSFAAGLISARLRGEGWSQAGRFAAASAAITVGRFGCSAGFPALGEVTDFLSVEPDLVVHDQR